MPRCSVVVFDDTGKTCQGVVDRGGSTLCSFHLAKQTEQWAEEFLSRADAGLTSAAALELPMTDKPLAQMSLEERRGLWLYLERRYPALQTSNEGVKETCPLAQ
jgi:hypothetical protein